jgi:hypothetical protein
VGVDIRGLDWVLVSLCICTMSRILAVMLYLRRPIVYRGAQTFVFPGMNIPQIIRPSGGVTRELNVRTAGRRRIASFIVPFRWERVDRSAGSSILISCNSSWIFSAWSGYRARK